MRISIRIMAIVFAVLLCFVFLLSSIRYVAFNQDIYRKIQVKQKIADFVLMPQESLDEVTIGLIEYMKGERKDIVFFSDYNENKTELFNDREKMHMEDVQELFDISLTVIIVALCLLMLILIAGFLMDMEIMKEIFIKTATITMVIVVLLFIMSIFYLIADFYNVWMFLHEMVFTNDLYFLDPYTDLLVNIMSLDFFVSICLHVGLYFGLLFIALFVMMCGTKLTKKVIKSE